MNPIKKPTQFELAMLAAIVSHRKKESLAAVEFAWGLWTDSGEVLECDGMTAGLSLRRSLNDPAVKMAWIKSGHAPWQFPASLNDFLRFIVRAKTPSDSMKRLRDFYRYEQGKYPDLYRDPADRIAEMKTRDREGGYFSYFEKWRSLADGYEIWWSEQKTSKARESASKRKRRS